jgi:uncharacterized protein (DUF1800 family)
MNATSIALNRFGLGARPDQPALADPPGWLLEQLDKFEALPPSWQAVPRSVELVQAWTRQQQAVRQAADGERSGIRETYLRLGRSQHLAAVGARTRSALLSHTPFVERLVHFWSNHFAVSVDKLLVVGLNGGYEADAIRPHVLGRFEDLLLAAVRHPAMLLYLDQATSSGPNSMAARRAEGRQQQRRPGLNENLAREIMELHTLGVRSGYTQEDVTELARALTGWTLPGEKALEASGTTFRFVPALHEPGARTVLGHTYPEDGEPQARAILRDLAKAPATAQHIATKLARHFVADDPPPALVQRLVDTFQRTGGDLPSLYRVLVQAPQAWQATPAKFKSPWDWAISSLRALGPTDLPSEQVANLMNQLGQPVWRPASPAGYGDLAASWAAPDALMRRVEVAQRLAAQFGGAVDARQLAPRVLPGALSDVTARAIAAAESPVSALALLLVSPEFLRR